MHRCDRAMIYVFIAGSYFPWVTLRPCPEGTLASHLNWLIWVMAFLGIVYQQIFHERYKKLETFFYCIMGVVPALTIVHNWVRTEARCFFEAKNLFFIFNLPDWFFRPSRNSNRRVDIRGRCGVLQIRRDDPMRPRHLASFRSCSCRGPLQRHRSLFIFSRRWKRHHQNSGRKNVIQTLLQTAQFF